MRRSGITALIMVSIFALLFSGCGKNNASWLNEINSVMDQGKYVVLYIDDGSSKESSEIRESFKENTDTMQDKFQFIEVNYKKDKESLLKYFNTSAITEFPLTLTIAPNGAVTRSFNQKCTAEQLNASILAKTECDTLLSIQKGKLALVCIHKGEPEGLKNVQAELKEIETYFNGVATVHYLNMNNVDDKAFIDKFPGVTTDLTVFIVVPPGSVAAQLENDEITSDNLLQVIQSSCGSGSCGSGGCN